MIRIEFSPQTESLMARLHAFPQRGLRAIADAIDKTNEETVGYIQKEKLSSRGSHTLGVRSGRLRRSIRPSKAAISGSSIVASIGSNVVYAGIHEFGGRTAPHEIRPRKGKALKFLIGGRAIYARKVNHPGSLIPARAPIRRGIEERKNYYTRAIDSALQLTLDGRS